MSIELMLNAANLAFVEKHYDEVSKALPSSSSGKDSN
jgi:NADH:ubiquinone oxidoreductase subunit K